MLVSGSEALRYFNVPGYELLQGETEHLGAVEAPPARYQDLADSILVAQALTETMRLLTHNATVARYADTVSHC